ncbi:DUF2975 domain-containing protein [Ferrimonas pelagia]|uniref:DUF2975 domain-containing protein n=1 Tax=Ferrimonas pelagia TaxID=1177826 RepID=A0ABP9F7R8_9GAMM
MSDPIQTLARSRVPNSDTVIWLSLLVLPFVIGHFIGGAFGAAMKQDWWRLRELVDGSVHILLGYLLLILALRLFRQIADSGSYTLAVRQLLVLMGRISLVTALALLPCARLLVHYFAQQSFGPLDWLTAVSWPLVVVAGVLHLLAGVQKGAAQLKQEQDLTV